MFKFQLRLAEPEGNVLQRSFDRLNEDPRQINVDVGHGSQEDWSSVPVPAGKTKARRMSGRHRVSVNVDWAVVSDVFAGPARRTWTWKR